MSHFIWILKWQRTTVFIAFGLLGLGGTFVFLISGRGTPCLVVVISVTACPHIFSTFWANRVFYVHLFPLLVYVASNLINLFPFFVWHQWMIWMNQSCILDSKHTHYSWISPVPRCPYYVVPLESPVCQVLVLQSPLVSAVLLLWLFMLHIQPLLYWHFCRLP